MGKNIDTNSKEWCDLIFEGRNKRYGAYKVRQSSAKRHVLAFIIVLCATALIVSVPILIERIQFYLFQRWESDYIKEDYKYITESLTELDMLKMSKQFIPNPNKSEGTPQITEEKSVTAEQLKKSIPVIVDESYIDEAIPEDLLPDSAATKSEKQKKETEQGETDDGLYLVVEEMPSFPGGEQGLMDYIYKNLRYPYDAQKMKIESAVICTFIIDTNGAVTQIEVTQSSQPLLDKEAIRVLKTLPKWQPARRHGKPIRVKYTIPIIFRLK